MSARTSESLPLLLRGLLACALVQCGIFGRLLYRGNAGGKLMPCLAPPCQRPYPLWVALLVFCAIAAIAFRALRVGTPAPGFASNALLGSAIGIALANVAIDVHYAHPIPHGGVSLNMFMHSDISPDEQALSPLLSVAVSSVSLGLIFVSHRAMADAESSSRASKAS